MLLALIALALLPSSPASAAYRNDLAPTPTTSPANVPSSTAGGRATPSESSTAVRVALRRFNAKERGDQSPEAFLDALGRVHRQLPNPADLGDYNPEELEILRDELEESVQARIANRVELGPDYGTMRASLRSSHSSVASTNILPIILWAASEPRRADARSRTPCRA